MPDSFAVELESLFNETSLFQVYRKAPSFFSNRFNSICLGCVALCLSALAILDFRVRDTTPPGHLLSTFMAWASLGVSLAGTILGFLIAGFAVLCTVLRPQTMRALQRLENKQLGESELKYLFTLFIDVLVQYLALLFWSLTASIVLSPIVNNFISIASRFNPLIPPLASHVLFVIWGSWLIALVLVLKSFIYNLYQSLLLGLADTMHDFENERLSTVCHASKLRNPE